MKSHFKELFSFSDRERNGVIVLLALIGIMIVVLFVQDKFISLPDEDFTAFDKFVSSLEKKSDSINAVTKNADREYQNSSPFPTIPEEAGTHSVYHTKELFNFNPNQLPEDDWVRLGLSPAQARCVKNYEAKGGKFVTKEDVKKLFVISAERYNELEPYIVLPEKSEQANSNSQAPNSSTTAAQPKFPTVIELNTADTADLMSINGIGPAFAKRILVYRERLGGFNNINQLTEVFGIDADKFSAIKDFVKVDPSYIHKININTAGVSDFKKMPYISPGVANALVNYRKTHGDFKSIDDVKGCVLVTADLFLKIQPYLTI